MLKQVVFIKGIKATEYIMGLLRCVCTCYGVYGLVTVCMYVVLICASTNSDCSLFVGHSLKADRCNFSI
jgi:hypothetical protein